MARIFDWWLLVWIARVLLVIVGIGGSFVSLLYFARFLRPRHMKALVLADLPTFTRVGAEVKLLGQELKASGDLATRTTVDERRVSERLDGLEGQVRDLFVTVDRLITSVNKLEARNVRGTGRG